MKLYKFQIYHSKSNNGIFKSYGSMSPNWIPNGESDIKKFRNALHKSFMNEKSFFIPSFYLNIYDVYQKR